VVIKSNWPAEIAWWKRRLEKLEQRDPIAGVATWSDDMWRFAIADAEKQIVRLSEFAAREGVTA